MKSVLEKLYNGEIYPAEQILPDDPAYWPLTHKISEEREGLKQKLDKEDADRLDKLSATHYEESGMNSMAGFNYGLRLGMRLTYEILMGPDVGRRTV